MARLLVARHGETTWNRDRRIQGWAPAPLTERGREQGRALGAHVAAEYDVDRLVSSDLRRAVETARQVRRAHADPPFLERSAGWRERDCGVLQGLSYDVLFEGYPEFNVAEVGYPAIEAAPEGGESLLDLQERVCAATDRLVASLGVDETALAITHGGPKRVVLGGVLGLDAVATVRDLEIDNCALTELAVVDDVEWQSREGDEVDRAPHEGADLDGVVEPQFPDSVDLVREAECGFVDGPTASW